MIIPSGYGQLTFLFDGTGVPTGAACTLGFTYPAPGGAIDVATAIAESFRDDVMVWLSSDVFLADVLVKLGPNDVGPSFLLGIGVQGGDTSDVASPNTCYLTSKFTALGGRRHRGRMYLPGVSESAAGSTGTVDPTKVTAINGGLQDVIDAAEGTLGNLVLLHSHPDDSPDVIEAWTCQSKTATQRRRLRR